MGVGVQNLYPHSYPHDTHTHDPCGLPTPTLFPTATRQYRGLQIHYIGTGQNLCFRMHWTQENIKLRDHNTMYSNRLSKTAKLSQPLLPNIICKFQKMFCIPPCVSKQLSDLIPEFSLMFSICTIPFRKCFVSGHYCISLVHPPFGMPF